jgi:hypothetical protein
MTNTGCAVTTTWRSRPGRSGYIPRVVPETETGVDVGDREAVGEGLIETVACGVADAEKRPLAVQVGNGVVVIIRVGDGVFEIV